MDCFSGERSFPLLLEAMEGGWGPKRIRKSRSCKKRSWALCSQTVVCLALGLEERQGDGREMVGKGYRREEAQDHYRDQ